MLSKFKFSIVLLLIIVTFLSCKDTKSNNETDLQQTAIFDGSEFREFYDKFSQDSVFQMEHIVFPLEGVRSVQDSLDIPSPDFKWEQATWKVHGPYDDMNGTYIREFFEFSGIVVEKISDTSGQYTMERRFGKLSSGWHLIYYREMGRY